MALLVNGLFIGLVLILNLQIINAQNPSQPPVISRISSTNHHMPLKEGPTNRFTLECQVKAVPEAEIKWFKNGEEIIHQQINGIDISNPETLDFTNPSSNLHIGYYHCEASNEMGRAKSEVIFVSPTSPTFEDWMQPPVLKEHPETAIPEFGESGQFKCVAEGSPRPKIVWTRNGEVMEEFNDKEILTIPSIEPKDVGTYACNASNTAGYDYKVVYLNILTQKPYFTEKPRNRTVSKGQDTILRVNVKGYPKPEIKWFFEGNEITNDSETYMISAQGDLTIKKIIADYEGSYECQASNEYGIEKVESSLKVVSKTTIINGPVDTEAQVKSNIRMNCEIVWDRKFELTVVWKRDNVNIIVDGTKIYVDEDDHSLTIQDLTFGDEGTYTCVAMTSTGTATDSGTLEVIGIPPMLVQGPSEITVKEQTDIELLCEISKNTFPLPKFTWFKDVVGDEPAHRVNTYDNNRIKISQQTGTLTIVNTKLDDSAKYICSATNGYGPTITASAFVSVRKRSIVKKEPEHVLLQSGQNAIFDCAVEVDVNLQDSTKIKWEFQKVNEENSQELNYSNTKYEIMTNKSLRIEAPTEADLGTYTCHVETPVDVVKLAASLYLRSDQTWIQWLIIVIICILIILITIMCIICVRKRSRRKGRYGVKDVSDGKSKNRSDIQYSIDDDTESLHKDMDPESATNRTPIIKPSSGKMFNSNGNSSDLLKGSENSLLNMTDEDMWLRKGMDEDGSFRQVYINQDQ